MGQVPRGPALQARMRGTFLGAPALVIRSFNVLGCGTTAPQPRPGSAGVLLHVKMPIDVLARPICNSYREGLALFCIPVEPILQVLSRKQSTVCTDSFNEHHEKGWRAFSAYLTDDEAGRR